MLFHQLDELIVQILFKGMHVHFSVPFTLLANYIRPGRDLSSAVKNKGIERVGIQIERALSYQSKPSSRS
jgi:NADH pyrophosphatase NudC (nudix superfamily)